MTFENLLSATFGHLEHKFGRSFLKLFYFISCNLLNKFKALLFVLWNPCFKEHRISSELSIQQWHVSVDLGEEVDALVSLLEVRVVLRQDHRAPGAPEGPSGRHLDRRLPGHVRDEKVHGDVLAVDELVHFVADGLGHEVEVGVAVILVVKGCPRQHHGQLARVV